MLTPNQLQRLGAAAKAAVMFPLLPKMRTLLILTMLALSLSLPALAQDANWKLWGASVAAYGAGTAADAWSTHQVVDVDRTAIELNPLIVGITGSEHRFGAPGFAIKGAIFAMAIIPQYFVVRKYPRSAKWFSIVNFGGAALCTGTAAHNMTFAK
jgi:hypothetical protein